MAAPSSEPIRRGRSTKPRLFGLDEAGWSKALKLGEYAARSPARPSALQEALFPYLA